MRYLFEIIKERPLKQMDEFLLAAEIESRANELGFEDEARKAIRLAAFAHSHQTRANRGPYPRDTYLTHPLRNAVRALRYGVVDPYTIQAIILHDVLEDGAAKIADTLMKFTDPAKDEVQARVRASVYIMEEFDPFVGALVNSVSNPIYVGEDRRTKDEKRAEYIQHVSDLIYYGPEVAVVKLVDIVDNGAGLYHNTGLKPEARMHLAKKYFPLMNTFLTRIQDEDVRGILSESGAKKAQEHLDGAKVSLASLLLEEYVGE